ncbi:hypothetical protein EBZ37_13975, partial [bacterium]|nr:hypothetical protein [bacterium]
MEAIRDACRKLAADVGTHRKEALASLVEAYDTGAEARKAKLMNQARFA